MDADQMELVIAVVHSGQVNAFSEQLIFVFGLSEVFQTDGASASDSVVVLTKQISSFFMEIIEVAGVVFVLFFVLRKLF